ncbi:hypothetical protein COHA_007840 [Chlorella ohadii]|uniref:Uncharacterized protein n=1 Tax=Chlorella ohadii TaxID=2649997 RepID=A0AAD5H274_9CHLO|nr:hypothetical protein COHA_007840 [Chlorella ohadii]
MRVAVCLLLICAGAAAAAAANDDWKKPDFCGQRDCPRFQLRRPLRSGHAATRAAVQQRLGLRRLCLRLLSSCPAQLEKGDGYETRRFNASWWVWTRFEDVSGWDVEEAASSKLFNYVLRHSFTRAFLRVVYSAADPACPLSHYSLQASAEVFNYFLGGNKDQKTIEMGAPLAHNFTMRERKAGWGPGDWAPSGWTTVDRRKGKPHLDVTVKMYLHYRTAAGSILYTMGFTGSGLTGLGGTGGIEVGLSWD